jgi:iron-sulfur cluster insertion protein
MQLSLTQNAAKKVAEIMKQDGYESHMLRVAVIGGGCSGFRYDLAFDDNKQDDDVVFEQHGVKIVSDEMSLEYLNGATVDYVEDMMGASFKIDNPNAKTGCGCGNSFST